MVKRTSFLAAAVLTLVIMCFCITPPASASTVITVCIQSQADFLNGKVTGTAPLGMVISCKYYQLYLRYLDYGEAAGDPIKGAEWSSTSPSVASVSDTGLVTVHSPGTTTIVARYGVPASDTSGNGTDTLKITVSQDYDTGTPAILTIDPVSENLEVGETAEFISESNYIIPRTRQWQFSANGTDWEEVEGADTDVSYYLTELTVKTTEEMDGYLYRNRIEDYVGHYYYSDAAELILTSDIYYDANGGTRGPDHQTKRCRDDLTLSCEVPERKGYTFVGWSRDMYAEEPEYQPGGTYRESVGTILYAVWKPLGWYQSGGNYYYYGSDGNYKTGWFKLNGIWYYFSSDGKMCTGWKKISNIWYYFETSGAMQTGWKKINNQWYYLNSSGAMQTGWQKISNQWYYFNSSGVMLTGWQTISGKTYYLKSNGQMAASEWINGWWLNKDGTWTYKYQASWKKNARGWWYGDSSGWYAAGKSFIIDGKSYTFDAAGYWIQKSQ